MHDELTDHEWAAICKFQISSMADMSGHGKIGLIGNSAPNREICYSEGSSPGRTPSVAIGRNVIVFAVRQAVSCVC